MAALLAGCTSSPSAPATPAETPAPAATTNADVQRTTIAAKTADIDTVVLVRFNDYACLNVQAELGRDYLYPDEKYRLTAAPPGVAGVNVNILFLDENDQLGLREIRPKWDTVQKKWVYDGIVPLAQFNDITGPVEKTFTIKTQSKYYICVDDRKETGLNDAMLKVPVKLLKI
jgi:hypothetical protein